MRKITALCGCLMYAVLAHAQTRMVAGTQEFAAALLVVKAGDTILWKNGHYHDLQIDFSPSQKGVSGRRIVLMAQTPGQVMLTGKSRIAVNGQWLELNGFVFQGLSTLTKEDVLSFSALEKTSHHTQHSLIQNCAVLYYNPADAAVNNNWMGIQGRYNEVRNCSFIGKHNQGPVMVVRYQLAKDAPEASNAAAPGNHHIHHNFFGYRTMPADNGGEHIRIGDSRTSFTSGQNLIEWNYFTQHRQEPEVISNKSWHNVYRYNSFIDCDGALVLRHGQQCFVYGNYINGSRKGNEAGGIRVVNPGHTIFNNYLENIEGKAKGLKYPITIMSGLELSAINEYYPADSALVAYNFLSLVPRPAFAVGVANTSKGKPSVPPTGVQIIANTIVCAKNSMPPMSPEKFPEDLPVAFTDNVWQTTAVSAYSTNADRKDEWLAKHQAISAIDAQILARASALQLTLKPADLQVFLKAYKMLPSSAGVRYELPITKTP